MSHDSLETFGNQNGGEEEDFRNQNKKTLSDKIKFLVILFLPFNFISFNLQIKYDSDVINKNDSHFFKIYYV